MNASHLVMNLITLPQSKVHGIYGTYLYDDGAPGGLGANIVKMDGSLEEEIPFVKQSFFSASMLVFGSVVSKTLVIY